MTRFALLPATLLLAACIGVAQTTPAGTPSTPANSVKAQGSATRNVRPDMAQLNVGVVTQADTAQAAAERNATIAEAVLKAVQNVVGTTGTVETLFYSINPRYTMSGNVQTLVGYVVTNTLKVVTTDVNRVSRIIDGANQAGANTISGPFYGLQDPDPEVRQALAAAAKQALGHATAIATGLGAKIGAVISAEEGSVVRPLVDGAAGAGATTTAATPIQTGSVTVSAYVTVTVALVQ